jgi:hypothetical protein
MTVGDPEPAQAMWRWRPSASSTSPRNRPSTGDWLADGLASAAADGDGLAGAAVAAGVGDGLADVPQPAAIRTRAARAARAARARVVTAVPARLLLIGERYRA